MLFSIPNHLSGLTPFKLLTKTKANHCDLLCTHVWGCPVYVLDPKLQDEQKIPKWNPCLHLGLFLGFSDSHSSLVANICHLSVGYVPPQYHLVFDDLFETVFSTSNEALLDDICNHLFDSDRDFYLYEDEITSNDPLVYNPPPLDEVWLSETECWACHLELEECCHIAEDCEQVKWIDKTPADPSHSLTNLIEQSDSKVKLQPVHLQSLFQKRK